MKPSALTARDLARITPRLVALTVALAVLLGVVGFGGIWMQNRRADQVATLREEGLRESELRGAWQSLAAEIKAPSQRAGQELESGRSALHARIEGCLDASDRAAILPADLRLAARKLFAEFRWAEESRAADPEAAARQSLRLATRAEVLGFSTESWVSGEKRRIERAGLRAGFALAAFKTILSVLFCVAAARIMARFGRYSTTLVHQLEERSEELERARLHAERSLEAKGVFLANMTHELRTPLNGILGMASLLRAGALSIHQSRCLDTIERSGQALLEIINDILDHAKIAQGKLVLERVPFCPRQEVESVLTLLSQGAFSKGLELFAEIDPRTPSKVLGDPGRFRQVLINLVGNAIKFTSSGEVSVHLAPMPYRGTSGLRIAVRDTGVGIAPDVVPRLFRPFEQADASTTRKYGGTGLGLSITNSLVKAMGGQVWVESVLGQGTEFSIEVALQVLDEAPKDTRLTGMAVEVRVANQRLRHSLEVDLLAAGARLAESEPGTARTADVDVMIAEYSEVMSRPRVLNDAARPVVLCRGDEIETFLTEDRPKAVAIPRPVLREELIQACLGREAGQRAASREAASSEKGGTSDVISGTGPALLLVEDNLVNQRVMSALLLQLGHRVTVAGNGKIALAEVTRKTFDLILMDMQMPEMNGLEATRAIRRLEQQLGRTRSKIVALTANAGQEDRVRCERAGMDGFIGKPVTLDTLSRMLQEHLPRAVPTA